MPKFINQRVNNDSNNKKTTNDSNTKTITTHSIESQKYIIKNNDNNYKISFINT